MMNRKITGLALVVLFVGFCVGLKAKAQTTITEELTYEDLVQQLSQKKTKIIQRSEPNRLDNLAMHAGLGLVASINEMNVEGRSLARPMNGFQLAGGIELFSSAWLFEGALLNFGTSRSGSESRSLREFDMKVVHRIPGANNLNYKLGSGLGTRFLKYSDSDRNIEASESNPSLLFFGGTESPLSKEMSLGLEGGFRTSLSDRSLDRTSFDIMVRLDTYF